LEQLFCPAIGKKHGKSIANGVNPFFTKKNKEKGKKHRYYKRAHFPECIIFSDVLFVLFIKRLLRYW
jgi:hypothetical protein